MIRDRATPSNHPVRARRALGRAIEVPARSRLISFRGRLLLDDGSTIGPRPSLEPEVESALLVFHPRTTPPKKAEVDGSAVRTWCQSLGLRLSDPSAPSRLHYGIRTWQPCSSSPAPEGHP